MPPSPVVIDQSSFIVVPGAARNVIEPSPVCSFTVASLPATLTLPSPVSTSRSPSDVFQRHRAVARRRA